jgi:hypothetical protein
VAYRQTPYTCARQRATRSSILEIVAKIAAGGSGSPTERLTAAVSVFARRALRSGRRAYAMIAEPTAPEVEVVRLQIRAELARVFSPIVAGGVASGELPPQAPAISGTALVGAVSEVLVGPLSGGSVRALGATTVAGAGGLAPVDEAALVDEIVSFAFTFRGRMVDAPHVAQARRLLARAGVEAGGELR